MSFKKVMKDLVFGGRVESVREYDISFDEILSKLNIKGELEGFVVNNSSKKIRIRVRF